MRIAVALIVSVGIVTGCGDDADKDPSVVEEKKCPAYAPAADDDTATATFLATFRSKSADTDLTWRSLVKEVAEVQCVEIVQVIQVNSTTYYVEVEPALAGEAREAFVAAYAAVPQISAFGPDVVRTPDPLPED